MRALVGRLPLGSAGGRGRLPVGDVLPVVPAAGARLLGRAGAGAAGAQPQGPLEPPQGGVPQELRPLQGKGRPALPGLD